MKKVLLVLLSILSLTCFLTACNKDNNEVCSHSYSEWDIVDEATCLEDGLKSHTCSKCGDVETQIVEAFGHTEVVDTRVEPTCTSTGLTEGKHCSSCNTVLINQEIIEKLEHSEVIHEAKVPTCGNVGWDKYVTCEREGCQYSTYNEISATGNHTWNDGEITTQPTCTTKGIKTFTCTTCGTATKTEDVKELGHDESTHQAKTPTCANIGWDEYVTCERDGCNYSTYYELPTTGNHTWNSGEITTQPTCTTKGIKTFTCRTCGTATKTEDVRELGHDELTHRAKSPTCANIGWKEYITCERENCDYSTYSEIPANGHTDGEWITDTNATCTENGSKYQVCSVCNATIKTEIITAQGHSYSMAIVNRNCGNNGKKAYTCSACEHSYDEEINSIILSLRHTSTSSITTNGYGDYSKGYAITISGGYGTILIKYELYTSATAANPTSTIDFTTNASTSVSFRGYANAIDDYVYKITAKDEAGNISIYKFSLKDESLIDYKHTSEVEHIFSDWTVVKEATCSEYGKKQSLCSVCNNIITDIVEKTPHTIVVDEAVLSNCLQTGLTEGSHCSVCETVIIEQIEIPAGEHSYENTICICGRDIIEDAIETWDLSILQDGSVSGYLINTNSGQKLYILGTGATKSYLYYGTNVSPFYKNKSITEVYIGDGVSSIGDCLFWCCAKLKFVNIPSSVTRIGSRSFELCSLSKITLPNGLLRIGNDAFSDNNNLTNIIFPKSLEYIGDGAFNSCNITAVYIPEKVSYIGEDVFTFNINLCEILVDINNSKYHSANNCIIETFTKTLIAGCKASVIPSDGSVINIAAYAFSGSKIKSLVIPSSIIKIGDFAFSACNLTKVVIPDSVKTMGRGVFYLCKSLTVINCEALSKPSNWDNKWNESDNALTVVWGYNE